MACKDPYRGLARNRSIHRKVNETGLPHGAAASGNEEDKGKEHGQRCWELAVADQRKSHATWSLGVQMRFAWG